MVLGWRRAFCTTIPRDREKQDHTNPSPIPSPKLGSKFKFFSSSTPSSNPSAPRFQYQQPVSSPNSTVTLRCKTAAPPASSTATVPTPHFPAESPKLQCKTTKSSPRFFNFSYPSSPRSPSTFSFLKSSLRNSKARCCICLQAMKTGQGTAIFTAECSHSFHFPCVAAHVQKESALICPVCNSTWKELPVLSIHNVDSNNNHLETKSSESPRTIHIDTNSKMKPNPQMLKVYNDDEPLMSPTSGGRFNPIPESDEENENVEFGGFFNSNSGSISPPAYASKVIDVTLSPEAAVISVGRSSETYAIVLKVKGPGIMGNMTAERAPIDLVTVVDVSKNINGNKLMMIKKVMRIMLTTLSPADRLSIVAFSSASKRLLPLRRMTTAGRRSARRIVEAIVAIEGTASSSTDAVKKAVKVLEDRREDNPATSIILLSDEQPDRYLFNGLKQHRFVSSSRFPHLEIPVHAISLSDGGACDHSESEGLLEESIRNILSVVVQDLSVRLGFISGSAQAEIAAVYTYNNRVQALGSGSIRVGELYAEEEREILVELKVSSSSSARAHRVLAVKCCYKDPSTQELINCKEQALLVPRPHSVRSSGLNIQRLRSRFITARALAEACRLIERNDLGGAHHMLASARALLLQSRPGSGSGIGSSDEFVRALEAELSELSRKKLSQQRDVSRRGLNVERDFNNGIVYIDEKAEPLTPASAWRAAEKLAKLAVMRKTMNRVSDLHGFENARF